MKAPNSRSSPEGFTLIEALITIAILSVMAGLLVSAFSNAATDTNRIVARQQQVAVQQAVNAWVNGDANRVTTFDAPIPSDLTRKSARIKTLEEIRTEYNQVITSSARFAKIAGYLDKTIVDQMQDSSITTNTEKIKSHALIATKQHLELPTWASGDFPQVNLVND